jgi:hypothetical protein
MHQQLWRYKVEWKSVSRGTGGKKVEYHWYRQMCDKDSLKFTTYVWFLRQYTRNHLI